MKELRILCCFQGWMERENFSVFLEVIAVKFDATGGFLSDKTISDLRRSECLSGKGKFRSA